MHMVGHEDVGPNAKLQLITCNFDAIGEPAAGTIRAKERKSMVTCECELVSMSWQIKVTSMRASSRHAN
jgi:hypothetical protein